MSERLQRALRAAVSAARGHGYVCVWRDPNAAYWNTGATRDDCLITAPITGFMWSASRGLAAALAHPDWAEFLSVHGQD